MYLQFGQFFSVSRGSLILNTPIHPLVKEGTTKMPTSNIKKQSILLQASDCTLQADLVKNCNFQTSSIRLSIQSMTTKHLVIVKLTVSWEEMCQSAYELKKAKYTDLHTDLQRAWMANLTVPSRGGLSRLSSTIHMDHI